MLDKVSLGLINLYQRYIRITLPCACRFLPSCSEYAKEAISKYGFSKGILRAMLRLWHCHPFSQRAAYDPLI